MSSISIADVRRRRPSRPNCSSRAALSSASLIALTAMLASAPRSAFAANECGAPVGGVVTCSGSSYPSPGISYNVNGLTVILDNPSLVAQKTTSGGGAVYLLSGAINVNDLVVNALSFQSLQTTQPLAAAINVANQGTAGNAIIRMDTGTATSASASTLGALLANITNNAGTGDALLMLNGGQVINTGTGYGATAQNAGTGNAGITMTGGSVSSASGAGLRAMITNTASSGAASVTIGGGTVTAASGTGVLSQSELGSAGITMTGGTVKVQGGTNPALSAVVNNAASTGTISIAMSGGTVTNNGSGDGLFASNKGTGTYDISVTGGTVTGGSGTGAAIHGGAAAGGTIAIGSGAIVNAGASGIALNQTGGAATITTAGAVTGNINLSVANNVLGITGGTIDGNISGGGNSALKFDLGSGSFVYGAAYAISGMDSVAMNSGSAQIDGSLATNTLAVNGGRLILNSAATVSSGGTMISAGTLQLGNGGASGSITGDVTNNGTLAFDRSDAYSFAGTISGSGTVDQAGSGTTILTTDNSYTGGTTISAGTLQLGNGGTSGSILGDVTNNGTFVFNRSDAYSFAGTISGSGTVNQAGSGTTILTADNSYTGGTTISAGTLQLGNGGTSGSILGDVTNNGTLTFDRSDVYIFDGVISGSGAIRQIGSGLTRLTGDSSGFTGTTSVVAGTLSVNGSLCGGMDVLAGGRLQGIGTVCDTTSAGTIAPGNSIGTLTVNGNYTGNGGTLEIETVLGGDASATDRLVVTGDTSGSTNVKVINVGGSGAQTVEGIKIIDVGGASDGTFSLLGDYVFQGDQAVVAGAYAYRLYKNGVSTPNDGDWYLRSALINGPVPDPSPLYAPGAPLYEAYAGVLQSFNQLGTLQQRTDGRSWAAGNSTADVEGNSKAQGIWGRIEAAHGHLEPGTSTTGTDYDVDTWKLQAGLDGALVESEAGTLIGGPSVHYGTASADVSSIFGLGDIDTTGYGLGGTLTWYGNNGLYVDAQGQLTWYDSDLHSATLSRTLTKGNNSFGYALSIETGQKIGLAARWSLTPQAQLSYSSVRFDDLTDPYGAAVSLRDGDTLIGRLGLSADYDKEWKDAAGQVSRSSVYGIANLYYDFLDGSDVDVSGKRFVSENRALWGGLGLGGSYSWSDERYSINGEAFAHTSLQDFGDSYSIGGKVSLNVKW
ncbi:autotransporter outer membrane beta-barrel domain-containing protein [Mesorhizobium captivum]|uniref:autotransporter outer membrane beta-barrel domain-containing protein n=1 Tax=Mesorhizobium captivum TaxID=3072319 RepID=UPI002A24E3E8|nr:autotransporter outer membrane beta-barrel domain-containing protein [Mesorhizobium sp. VK22E]MDX8504215.1 autotransporter outer membrane beta-barrel domain-containing protein [Mesorhizobium sp. VK22E]